MKARYLALQGLSRSVVGRMNLGSIRQLRLAERLLAEWQNPAERGVGIFAGQPSASISPRLRLRGVVRGFCRYCSGVSVIYLIGRGWTATGYERDR